MKARKIALDSFVQRMSKSNNKSNGKKVSKGKKVNMRKKVNKSHKNSKIKKTIPSKNTIRVSKNNITKAVKKSTKIKQY